MIGWMILTGVALAGFVIALPASKKTSPETWTTAEKLGFVAMILCALIGVVAVVIG